MAFRGTLRETFPGTAEGRATLIHPWLLSKLPDANDDSRLQGTLIRS